MFPLEYAVLVILVPPIVITGVSRVYPLFAVNVAVYEAFSSIDTALFELVQLVKLLVIV